MRSNQRHHFLDDVWQGSISAHAEQPRQAWLASRAGRVYLRACGATHLAFQGNGAGQGLSPRMRSNHEPHLVGAHPRGSISAHAEQPAPSTTWPAPWWVYLRACGATPYSASAPACCWGLSPRMRSNLLPTPSAGRGPGSISAHAEQPYGPDANLTMNGVYLRACGATVPACRSQNKHQGLSPRMRSNRPLSDCGADYRGSISAHAEQPTTGRRRPGKPGVYLRACGATMLGSHSSRHQTGLSPRMRSNRDGFCHGLPLYGSISAHAEQPEIGSAPFRRVRVYLRACGATSALSCAYISGWGLSPRMRSNLRRGSRSLCRRGSISAHAEQPSGLEQCREARGVYLRACGATLRCVCERSGKPGLSPRMRSNRHAPSRRAC